MYCAINFSETDETESNVAFLGDDVEVFTVNTNEEIIELVAERTPQIVAVNTGLKEMNRLSEGEEDLREEGHIFTPSQHDTKRVRRFQAFKGLLERKISGDEIPEFIRFDAMITGRELAIDSDSALESYGVDSSEISSSGEFDAVLGVVTARFYDQGQAEDNGVTVPNPLEEKDKVEQDPRQGESEKIQNPDEEAQNL